MPSTNQYNTRDLVYVRPFPNAGCLYGFRTNVDAATSAACGHNPVIPGSEPPQMVIGANAPKPGRASKLVGDQYNSSFYDYEQYAALKLDGWRTTRPFRRRPTESTRSTACYVTIGGIKYAWNMAQALRNKIGADFAGLGITEASILDRDLVWGASFPRPPRAAAIVAGDFISTFYDSAITALPPGWGPGGGSRETIAL